MGPAIRMLILEDEAILAMNLMAYIQRFGWDVMIASSGQQTLAIADSFRPDVLLLDYCLPDMTGFEVLDTMRSDCKRYRCDNSCILMTAHPTSMVLVDAQQRGIHRILYKPFSLTELDPHLLATEAMLQPSSIRARPIL